MTVPPEVVRELIYTLGVIALGGLALLIGAFLGHLMGGLLEEWIQS